jgi:hypothetical protein
MEISDILHIGSDKQLICRDGNKDWANSMDLEFMTYDEYKIINNNISIVELCPKVLIIDISVGWTDTKYINLFEKIINNKDNTKIYFRLVDQFRYQWTSEIYEWVTKISNTKGIKIIKTYDCDYNGLNSLVTLPYPYLIEDEFPILNEGEDKFDRSFDFLLSGADIKDIYPIRCKLYDLSEDFLIKTLRHPGYSGNHWSKGKIGYEYLKELHNHWFMACTTTHPDKYDLLKYVECAEAGCVCVGEVPKMLEGTEAEKWIIKIPDGSLKGIGIFYEWFNNTLKDLDVELYASEYRRCIKEMRDKEKIKRLLLDSINSDL